MGGREKREARHHDGMEGKVRQESTLVPVTM